MTYQNTPSSKSNIPVSAKYRLYRVGSGWVLVAALEALTYTVLALSLVKQAPPLGVISTAIIAILVTVLVTRSGFLSGAQLAGDLYSAVGQSLS
ncbi:ABC transporter, partial [Vibrio anguillarum]|nr:ABC transporter [Vibrio anguillarum]